MARPKKEQARTLPVAFRMTEAEVAKLDRRARAAGLKRSAYGREVLLGGTEAPRAAVKFKPGYEYAAASLSEQVRRVGVNLNQWVRRMNETATPPPAEARLALIEIRELVRQARDL